MAAHSGAGKHRIEDLSWLAGSWVTPEENGTRVDERWSGPEAGAMLGSSRTVKDGKVSEFEYLSVVERHGRIVYIAHPGGRPDGTEFRLTSLTTDASSGKPEIHAVFENPDHDFPKRILYVRRADGSLVAAIDGGDGTRRITFAYRPDYGPEARGAFQDEKP